MTVPSDLLIKYCLASVYQDFLSHHYTKLHTLPKFEELIGLSDILIEDFLKRTIDDGQITALRRQLQEEMAKGVHFTFPTQSDFPTQFLKMHDAPYLLRYLGTPVWNSRSGLAVVGARDIMPLSVKWMEINLVEWLKDRSVFIVSGGARGVDQLAHQICLRAGQPTVIFIPSGLGNLYPSALDAWINKVIELGGAIVSEYSHYQQMRKHFFQARNRLIAAMGVGTLIIQATRRSGTIITANRANMFGRPVWVVPGHPLDFHFAGNNDLMFDGATPIRDCSDLGDIFAAEMPLWKY